MDSQQKQEFKEEILSDVWSVIGKDSAPYLSVDYFLTSLLILLPIFGAILAFIWRKIGNNTDEIESTEDKIRKEFQNKIDRLDDKLWNLKDDN